MRIHVGCELSFDFPQTTPMIATLSVHFSRCSDLERPDPLMTNPAVPVEGYRDISLFFDKNTNLLLKTEMKGKDAMSGDEFTMVTTFGNYKKTDGLMTAHSRVEKHDDKPYLEMEMTAITPSESLDDKHFAKP